MLKIKDNVKPEELEKYKIFPHYIVKVLKAEYKREQYRNELLEELIKENENHIPRID